MTVKFEYIGNLSDGKRWDLDSSKRVSIELNDNDLTVNELLEEFMNFLQAVGYKFDLGDSLEVVNRNFPKFDLDSKNFKFDFSKFDGESDPGFGAVPPSHD